MRRGRVVHVLVGGLLLAKPLAAEPSGSGREHRLPTVADCSERTRTLERLDCFERVASAADAHAELRDCASKSSATERIACFDDLARQGPRGPGAPAELHDEDGLFRVVEVVHVPGVGGDLLYTRARLWVAEAFVDSDKVLEVEEPEKRLLVGKGTVSYAPTVFESSRHTVGQIRFKVTVQAKDGRARLILGPFSHEATSSIGVLTTGEFGTSAPAGCTTTNICKGWLKRLHVDLTQQATNTAKAAVGSFGAALTRASVIEDDDW